MNNEKYMLRYSLKTVICIFNFSFYNFSFCKWQTF